MDRVIGPSVLVADHLYGALQVFVFPITRSPDDPITRSDRDPSLRFAISEKANC